MIRRLVRAERPAGHRPVLVSEPAPELPDPGWRRVSVTLAGVCGSDLIGLAGPGTLGPEPERPRPGYGHEIVGVLLDDAPAGLPAGTRVAVHPLITCAALDRPPCAQCRLGGYGQCLSFGRDGRGLSKSLGFDSPHGGWADQVVAHPAMLRPLPDGLEDRTAVLAEPLSVALSGLWTAPVEPAAAVVVGGGTLGQLAALAVAELYPDARRGLLVRHWRQAAAGAAIGAATVLDPSVAAVARWHGAADPDPPEAPATLRTGPELVVDTGGTTSSLDLALAVAGCGGVVLTLGNPSASDALHPLWLKRLRLIGHLEHGARERGDGRWQDSLSAALDLLARTPTVGNTLVTDIVPLADHDWAWELARKRPRRHLKIALAP